MCLQILYSKLVLAINSIKKNFGPFTAVSNISFRIDKGEIVGLLGPNGAGKTTTMRLITGFYTPSEGDILLDGESIRENRYSIQKKIGYLPESSSVYSDMLVCDFLNFVGNARDLKESELKSGIEMAVSSTSLHDYYYRPISHLSKGYKQRLGLASVLIHNPEILILDEPTSGLDPNQIVEIQDLIKKLSATKTIILSTHILKEVEETCKRCIIINQGSLVLDKQLSELDNIESSCRIRFAVKGSQEKMQTILSNSFGQNIAIDTIDISKEKTSAEVVVTKDISEDIFHLSVKNNWVLQELYQKKEGLNYIFQKLTMDLKEDLKEESTNK